MVTAVSIDTCHPRGLSQSGMRSLTKVAELVMTAAAHDPSRARLGFGLLETFWRMAPQSDVGAVGMVFCPPAQRLQATGILKDTSAGKEPLIKKSSYRRLNRL